MSLFFITACDDLLDSDNDDNGSDYVTGAATDIDGNVYQSVIIGNQEWLTENLRVSRYNNGDAITTGLSNAEWGNATQGAYAIIPHAHIDGLDSDAEVAAAYGKLYNWLAVDDTRGLCPEGWHVPGNDDWTQLVDYLMDEYDYHNGQGGGLDGVGNALKSCRQVDSPLGGDCNTSVHPRWDQDDTHHGFDQYGFSAVPGGLRMTQHGVGLFGELGSWWSSTEYETPPGYENNGRSMVIYHNTGHMHNWPTGSNKKTGFSVRCIRTTDD